MKRFQSFAAMIVLFAVSSMTTAVASDDTFEALSDIDVDMDLHADGGAVDIADFLDGDGLEDAAHDESQGGLRKLSNKKMNVKHKRTVRVNLDVTNLSFQQPFGRFFVMVHNSKIDPLFTLGMPSSAGLRELAENGNPDVLVEEYKNNRNVLYVGSAGTDPVFGGGKLRITVPVRRGFLRVTIGSMCLNTNDW